MASVTLDRVSKSFGDVVAVRDFSLHVDDREFVILVGPSGCGKSTTLRIVAGLDAATSGNVYIGERLVDDVPPKGRDIAMVFQNYALYPHMNVYENISFGLRLRRVPARQIEEKVRKAAQILGISDLLHRLPRELSGGERQRVALGRAIVREPKVFLMDEPLSNLDAKLRVQMRTELAKLHRQLRSTIIYVTHDQTEAMTMGDRIVVMKDGLVQQIAAPQDVYDRPANMFVASFIGSPPMNFVDCAVLPANGGLSLFAGDMSISVPAEKANLLGDYVGKSVVIGVRPEDITDDASFVEAHPSWSLDALVEVVEPLGAEVYVYLKVGPHPLAARVAPSTRATDGTRHRVALNMRKMHAFDPSSHEAII